MGNEIRAPQRSQPRQHSEGGIQTDRLLEGAGRLVGQKEGLLTGGVFCVPMHAKAGSVAAELTHDLAALPGLYRIVSVVGNNMGPTIDTTCKLRHATSPNPDVVDGYEANGLYETQNDPNKAYTGINHRKFGTQAAALSDLARVASTSRQEIGTVIDAEIELRTNDSASNGTQLGPAFWIFCFPIRFPISLWQAANGVAPIELSYSYPAVGLRDDRTVD